MINPTEGATMTRMTAAEFVAEAQEKLDRAKAAGKTVVVDIYTREVAIREKIVAKG